MIEREYKNFDQIFYRFNREVLKNPWEMLEYTNGILGYMDNVFIKCHSSDCTIDLSTFAYKAGKWSHLLRTYIDWGELVKFKERLYTATGLSLTYYFKQKKVNNGSCLIGIVLSRKNRKKQWDKVNVIYRTTEVQRRFAADLVLVHHFINELPDCCDIKEITFYMAQMYISANIICGYYEYFKVPLESLDDTHPWIRTLLSVYNRNFVEGSRITTYQSQAKLQKLKLGLVEYPKIPIDSLSIQDYFERG